MKNIVKNLLVLWKWMNFWWMCVKITHTHSRTHAHTHTHKHLGSKTLWCLCGTPKRLTQQKLRFSRRLISCCKILSVQLEKNILIQKVKRNIECLAESTQSKLLYLHISSKYIIIIIVAAQVAFRGSAIKEGKKSLNHQSA